MEPTIVVTGTRIPTLLETGKVTLYDVVNPTPELIAKYLSDVNITDFVSFDKPVKGKLFYAPNSKESPVWMDRLISRITNNEPRNRSEQARADRENVLTLLLSLMETHPNLFSVRHIETLMKSMTYLATNPLTQKETDILGQIFTKVKGMEAEGILVRLLGVNNLKPMIERPNGLGTREISNGFYEPGFVENSETILAFVDSIGGRDAIETVLNYLTDDFGDLEINHRGSSYNERDLRNKRRYMMANNLARGIKQEKNSLTHHDKNLDNPTIVKKIFSAISHSIGLGGHIFGYKYPISKQNDYSIINDSNVLNAIKFFVATRNLNGLHHIAHNVYTAEKDGVLAHHLADQQIQRLTVMDTGYRNFIGIAAILNQAINYNPDTAATSLNLDAKHLIRVLKRNKNILHDTDKNGLHINSYIDTASIHNSEHLKLSNIAFYSEAEQENIIRAYVSGSGKNLTKFLGWHPDYGVINTVMTGDFLDELVHLAIPSYPRIVLEYTKTKPIISENTRTIIDVEPTFALTEAHYFEAVKRAPHIYNELPTHVRTPELFAVALYNGNSNAMTLIPEGVSLEAVRTYLPSKGRRNQTVRDTLDQHIKGREAKKFDGK